MITINNIEESADDLNTLFEYSLINFFTGEITYLFEFFYFYRLLHYKFRIKLTNKFLLQFIDQGIDIMKELYDTCLNLVKISDKNKIENINNLDQDDFYEVITAIAFLNYSGNLKKDFIISLEEYNYSKKLFEKIIEVSENVTSKRFCSYMVYKIQKKKMKMINEKDLEENKTYLASAELNFAKICEELYDKDTCPSFSESYYQNLGMIYHKGIGVTKNLIKAYSFYKGGSNRPYKELISNSVISCYKRHQCKQELLNTNFLEEVKALFKDLKIKLLENSKEDHSKCEICFVTEKEIIFLPCLHYICCFSCSEKIISSDNHFCPMCRGIIAYSCLLWFL